MRHKYAAYCRESSTWHLKEYDYAFDDEPPEYSWEFMGFVGFI